MSVPRLDSKREEFRVYLEKSGFISSLSKALVGLYEEPEKPTNPSEFVTQRICRDDPSAPDKSELIAQIKELQERVTQLELENEELRRNIIQAGSGFSGQNSAINHHFTDN